MQKRNKRGRCFYIFQRGKRKFFFHDAAAAEATTSAAALPLGYPLIDFYPGVPRRGSPSDQQRLPRQEVRNRDCRPRRETRRQRSF